MIHKSRPICGEALSRLHACAARAGLHGANAVILLYLCSYASLLYPHTRANNKPTRTCIHTFPWAWARAWVRAVIKSSAGGERGGSFIGRRQAAMGSEEYERL